jgi:hypothetical protein
MKTNRILTFLFAGALALFSLQSCLFEQKDLFEDSASARLSKTLANAKTVLTQQTGGWIMYYYPDNDQYYGGYNYIVKFTDEEATVWSEIFDGASTSLYKMTTNNGPVLSFDTSNHNFHYFATPSGSGKNTYGESGRYQAYRGDFEFLILSATPEKVQLKGTRSGCLILMVPFTGGDPAAYMAAVNKNIEDIFVSDFTGTIGSDNLHLFLDLSYRQAEINLEEDEENVTKVAYIYTDKGIRLYKPVTIGSNTFQELDWDAEAQKLVSSGAVAIDLKGKLPDGWHAYNDYLGSWNLTFNAAASVLEGVTFTEDVKGESYIISGLSDQFTVKATYNLGTGKVQLLSQIVGTNGGYSVRMAAWDSKAGKVTYTDTIGFFLTFGANADGVDDGTTIYFSDNRVWGSYVVNGFILYNMNGSTRIGGTSAPWIFAVEKAGVTTDLNRLKTPTVLTRAK